MTTNKELIAEMCEVVIREFCDANQIQAWYDGYFNPPLDSSLDAWREIWEAMKSLYQLPHDYTLLLREQHGKLWGIRASPLHHLEAAMRAIGKWEAKYD